MNPISRILALVTLVAITSLPSCGKQEAQKLPPAKGKLIPVENVGYVGDLDGDGDADYVSALYDAFRVRWVAPDMRGASLDGFVLSSGKDMTPRMQQAATGLLLGYTDPNFEKYLTIFREEAGQ